MTSPTDWGGVFESFLNAGQRSTATHELAKRGAEAVPLLEALFTGEAKNAWGHPYASIGALDCGLVTAKLLGPRARPLEHHLRAALRDGHIYAAEALGALETLEAESIVELARSLDAADLNLAAESAAALGRCGAQSHPAVAAIIEGSRRASWILGRFAAT